MDFPKSGSAKLLRRNSLSQVTSKQPFIQYMKAKIMINQRPSHVRIDKEFNLNYETSPRRKKQLLIRARTRSSLSRTPERQLHFDFKGCQSSRNVPGNFDFESQPSSSERLINPRKVLCGAGLPKPMKSFTQLIQRSSNLQKFEKENTASITQKLVLHKAKIPSTEGNLFSSAEMKRAVKDFQLNFYSSKMVSTLRQKRKTSKPPLVLA